MRYAVFADIHGNLEALQVALEYVRGQHLTHFLILGDSVGYGANPNECLEWALTYTEFQVLGNHEAAVLHEDVRNGFTDWARIAIDWTAGKLDPKHLDLLRKLPFLRKSRGFSLAHGTIHAPERFDYLFDLNAAHKSFLAMETSVGFVGHSHVPCFFSEGGEDAGHLKPGVLRLTKGERYLLNPGSIGQPRDHDPRLSFGIYDEGELTFEIVRLPYDNKLAAQKIRAEGLPEFLAERLL
ncbi:MAG TPA: metallophosphoesterase family protein [Candidatus Omnitrophota bacterium]|nr:metallophosphoesterase family protein [Candidatus Omnitrophota bacterium]HPS36444.1 metallophosphoesterase family protein [Candidatus Omnitrophota bacterium]